MINIKIARESSPYFKQIEGVKEGDLIDTNAKIILKKGLGFKPLSYFDVDLGSEIFGELNGNKCKIFFPIGSKHSDFFKYLISTVTRPTFLLTTELKNKKYFDFKFY